MMWNLDSKGIYKLKKILFGSFQKFSYIFYSPLNQLQTQKSIKQRDLRRDNTLQKSKVLCTISEKILLKKMLSIRVNSERNPEILRVLQILTKRIHAPWTGKIRTIANDS